MPSNFSGYRILYIVIELPRKTIGVGGVFSGEVTFHKNSIRFVDDLQGCAIPTPRLSNAFL